MSIKLGAKFNQFNKLGTTKRRKQTSKGSESLDFVREFAPSCKASDAEATEQCFEPKRVKFSLGTGICYAGLSLQRTFRHLTAGGVLLRVTQDSLARLANANLAAITQQKSRTNNMRRGRIHWGPPRKKHLSFREVFFTW